MSWRRPTAPPGRTHFGDHEGQVSSAKGFDGRRIVTSNRPVRWRREAPSIRCHNRPWWYRPFAAPAGVAGARLATPPLLAGSGTIQRSRTVVRSGHLATQIRKYERVHERLLGRRGRFHVGELASNGGRIGLSNPPARIKTAHCGRLISLPYDNAVTRSPRPVSGRLLSHGGDTTESLSGQFVKLLAVVSGELSQMPKTPTVCDVGHPVFGRVRGTQLAASAI